MPPVPRTRSAALNRVSTVNALVAALRDQVLEGGLLAGTPLREAELCDAFGVSRHTVRTALQALAHEGLARHEPNRGAYVPLLTAEDVADLFRLRAMLELTAVRALAADPALREPVRDAVARLEELGKSGAWTEVRDADLAFHRAIVDALGSPRASRTYATLITELRLCFLQLQRELEDPEVVARQHADILAAIESGDADRGADALREHLGAAAQDITDAYRSQDQAGQTP